MVLYWIPVCCIVLERHFYRQCNVATASQACGSAVYPPDTMWTQESIVPWNGQSALGAAASKRRDSLIIWLCYWTSGMQEQLRWWTIKSIQLWDKMWEETSMASNHHGSDHNHWLLWWQWTGYDDSLWTCPTSEIWLLILINVEIAD